jgi:hypothetical protein
MERVEMQTSIALAERVLSILEKEDFHQAVDGLKIAQILLAGKANCLRDRSDEILPVPEGFPSGER